VPANADEIFHDIRCANTSAEKFPVFLLLLLDGVWQRSVPLPAYPQYSAVTPLLFRLYFAVTSVAPRCSGKLFRSAPTLLRTPLPAALCGSVPLHAARTAISCAIVAASSTATKFRSGVASDSAVLGSTLVVAMALSCHHSRVQIII
jgi:hypothetical protein